MAPRPRQLSARRSLQAGQMRRPPPRKRTAIEAANEIQTQRLTLSRLARSGRDRARPGAFTRRPPPAPIMSGGVGVLEQGCRPCGLVMWYVPVTQVGLVSLEEVRPLRLFPGFDAQNRCRAGQPTHVSGSRAAAGPPTNALPTTHALSMIKNHTALQDLLRNRKGRRENKGDSRGGGPCVVHPLPRSNSSLSRTQSPPAQGGKEKPTLRLSRTRQGRSGHLKATPSSPSGTRVLGTTALRAFGRHDSRCQRGQVEFKMATTWPVSAGKSARCSTPPCRCGFVRIRTSCAEGEDRRWRS